MVRTNDICRILNSLEKKRVAMNGEFSFVWKRPFFKRYLSLTERINPHIAIVGQSGSGKSNAACTILQELSTEGFNFIVLDPKNDYVGIAKQSSAKVINARHNGINIFERGNASISEKTSELSGIFQRYLRLGHVQTNVLYRCIRYTYEISERKMKEPSFSSLIFTVKVFRKNAEIKGNKGEATTLEYLLTRFSSLEYLDSKNTIKISEAVNSRSIFMLEELGTAEAQSIFMEGMLRQIYTYAVSSGRTNNSMLYIVVDEAGKLGDNPILGRLVSEGRKYGIGIISISQSVKSLDKDVRCNSSLFISFYVREPEELNYISSFISGGTDGDRLSKIKSALRNLRLGEAVAMDYYHKEPLIVRFVKSQQKRYPISYLIEENVREVVRKVKLVEKIESEGFIAKEIEDTIKNMIEKGKIISHKIEFECAYDDIWYSLPSANTPEHDISVKIIAMHLKSLGVYAEIYNKAYGPDVIAELNGKRYAIEYETGLKNFEDTKLMILNRVKTYANVIILCKKEILEKYNCINEASCMDIGSFLRYEKSESINLKNTNIKF